jgi:hypothetical protein
MNNAGLLGLSGRNEAFFMREFCRVTESRVYMGRIKSWIALKNLFLGRTLR